MTPEKRLDLWEAEVEELKKLLIEEMRSRQLLAACVRSHPQECALMKLREKMRGRTTSK